MFCFNLPGIFLVRKLFRNLPDEGYALIKVAGLLLVALPVWELASLHLLPFSQRGSWSIFLIATLASMALTFKFFRSERSLKSHLKIIFLEEILFLGGLTLWAFVRSWNPDIHGLEKFMDFAFLNSLLRSSYFPPADPWLAGKSINYYYFGHFVAALLTKMTGLAPENTYNLMIATVFGLTFSGVFSLGFNLFALHKQETNGSGHKTYISAVIVGLLAAILITLGGNLHTIYAFTKGYAVGDNNPKPPWELLGAPNPGLYWYPSAVRFIPYTIHEIPSYSFIVSDMHAHLLDIPAVLLTLTVLLALIMKIAGSTVAVKNLVPSLQNFLRSFSAYFLFLSVLVAVMYMGNSLDGAIYSLLLFLLLLGVLLTRGQRFLMALALATGATFLVLIPALILALPFSLNFDPFARGIGVNCSQGILQILGLPSGNYGPLYLEGDKCQRTPLFMFLIVWGFPIFTSAIFAIMMLRQKTKSSIADLYVLSGTVLSLLLIIFPEFFYFKDIYPLHFRANTMFKLGYQSSIMFSVFAAYIVFRLRFRRRWLYPLFGILLLPQLFLILIYPYFSINGYYPNRTKSQPLDGLKYLAALYPDDYQAILWLKKNISGQPVVLEMVGESYTDKGLISSNTGLPTVLGWAGHEWGWHSGPQIVNERSAQVRTIYEQPDSREARNLLRLYKVQYLVVSNFERQAYPGLSEAKIASLGNPVFVSGTVNIYQVNKNLL